MVTASRVARMARRYTVNLPFIGFEIEAGTS